MDDLRDRMARAEQNHLNLKENFTEFKRTTHEEFASLNTKMDEMMETVDKKMDQVQKTVNESNQDIHGIKLLIAKCAGGGAVLVFIGQFLVDRFLK